MKLLLIGDVHGLVDKYNTLLKRHKPERSLQLGDFGFKQHHQWHRLNVNARKHKVLLGNHDDTNMLRSEHVTRDYGIDEPTDGYYMRGAYSIDRHRRTEGKDWWADEELSYSQCQQAIDLYAKHHPQYVLTHDCPEIARNNLFDIWQPTRTSQALQTMWEIHHPRLWVFGHHHRSVDVTIDGTRFVCLNELEAVWLDTDTLELTKP